MSLKVDAKEVKRKNGIIDNAIKQLKSEFVGIDEQIDEVMNVVRVWYLYPELQTSPCVVNIFGMSGTGKTSLVRRITQLLDIERDMVYFNFAAISEMNSWEVEQDIEEQLNNERSNRVFVYDEFQYAATLDEHGAEKDDKNGLKPFWELLDTGVLRKRSSFWEIRDIFRVMAYMTQINVKRPMEIVNGVWLNVEECMMEFVGFDKTNFRQVFNMDGGSHNKFVPTNKLCENVASCNMDCDEESEGEGDFFLHESVLNRIKNMYNKTYGKYIETGELYHMLCGMDAVSIIDFLTDIYDKSQKGYDLKFHNSIIFVIGNLDEAYEVAFDVNPDMSPDQFHKITQKISIVDIKQALQKRFRNEQIARLGNIHVIYPSFSSNSFKKIIDIKLHEYAKMAEELCGLEVGFDKNIEKVIYDEAVYPTHGTRPIISTINEVVKTKLPNIIGYINDNNLNDKAEKIVYSFKGGKSVLYVQDKDGENIGLYKFEEKLRLKKLRDNTKDEEQANTAVHESGHFAVFAYLNGYAPEKLISKSADSSMGGFMMNDIDKDEKEVSSKASLLNKIKIALGGYVAEELIFGKDYRSSGASGDLAKATEWASQMVRCWGMDDIPYVTTHLEMMENKGMFVKEEDQTYINERIKVIVVECMNDVRRILQKENVMNLLKASSKYLAEHILMPKHVMNALISKAKEEGEMLNTSKTFYRDIVKNL